MPRFRLVVVVAVTALLLSGCTMAPEPAATPAASPTPTATAEPALRPNALFDIDCAELLTMNEVQSTIAAPVSVLLDENNVGSSVTAVAQRTRGALVCSWGGDRSTSFNLLDDELSVVLLPDGAADFASIAQDVGYPDLEVPGADETAGGCVVGDVSEGFPPNRCSLWALADTTMLSITFADRDGTYASVEQLTATIVEVAERMLTRAQDAGPREQEWASPPSPVTADDAFCEGVGTELLAQLGVDTPYRDAGPFAGVTGVTNCVYFFGATDVPGIVISVVEGAAWAARPGLAAVSTRGERFEPRTTSSGTPWLLELSDQFVGGQAAMGGSLANISVGLTSVGVTAEQAVSAVSAVMEEYAEVPPGS